MFNGESDKNLERKLTEIKTGLLQPWQGDGGGEGNTSFGLESRTDRSEQGAKRLHDLGFEAK